MIPIILITRNNVSQLKRCVESIRNNTRHPYDLHIVDNVSDDRGHLEYLDELENNGNAKIWHENSNRWVLSVNSCLATLDKESTEYYVISDSDIIFPESNDQCWLTELVRCMNQYPFLGKLGLSISTENLHNKPHLAHILEIENKYSSFDLTPEIYLALVDTTAAIYRPDIYVWEKFKLYPRHLWAMKPGYYSGRHKNLTSHHLGWDEDEYNKVDTISNSDIESKIKCFAKYAGRIDVATLRHASIKTRLYYYLVSPLGRLLWGGNLIYNWIFYIVRSRLIRLNNIMARLR